MLGLKLIPVSKEVPGRQVSYIEHEPVATFTNMV